ncbi:MAG: hypothetical protein ABW219_17920 [Ilumatobacteraceae bacterium]
MQITRYMLGTIAAGALTVTACGGGDSLEDGWNDLSDEEQASICEVFNSDAMTDEMLEQVVEAANEEGDTDVSPEEFRTFLEDNC